MMKATRIRVDKKLLNSDKYVTGEEALFLIKKATSVSYITTNKITAALRTDPLFLKINNAVVYLLYSEDFLSLMDRRNMLFNLQRLNFNGVVGPKGVEFISLHALKRFMQKQYPRSSQKFNDFIEEHVVGEHSFDFKREDVRNRFGSELFILKADKLKGDSYRKSIAFNTSQLSRVEAARKITKQNYQDFLLEAVTFYADKIIHGG